MKLGENPILVIFTTHLLGKIMIQYSKQQVKRLRENRKLAKTNGKGQVIQSDKDYQSFLGELKGAGHLQLNGFQSLQKQVNSGVFGPTSVEYQVKFTTPGDSKQDRPHFTGYLQSAADVDDKRYRVKAWLNDNGVLRLEIVK